MVWSRTRKNTREPIQPITHHARARSHARARARTHTDTHLHARTGSPRSQANYPSRAHRHTNTHLHTGTGSPRSSWSALRPSSQNNPLDGRLPLRCCRKLCDCRRSCWKLRWSKPVTAVFASRPEPQGSARACACVRATI